MKTVINNSLDKDIWLFDWLKNFSEYVIERMNLIEKIDSRDISKLYNEIIERILSNFSIDK